MAKGNLFLGTASGKVGDVVFARDGGEQISRVRVRHPRNPQTPIQLLQRVLFKTSSSAFSLFQDICNHSFQNIEGKVMNQARFNKLNVAQFRLQCADLINVDDPAAILSSELVNFTASDEFGAPVNSYIVSEGSLPAMSTLKHADGFALRVPGVTSSQITYEELISALGVSRGDQLTFILVGVDDTNATNVFSGIAYARIILEPAGGELDVQLAGSDFDEPLNSNPNNEGSIKFKWVPAQTASGSGQLVFEIDGLTYQASNKNTACAATVIASHRIGDKWQRSTQQLTVRNRIDAVSPLSYEHRGGYLGDAVRSLMSQATSSLYLNQAE